MKTYLLWLLLAVAGVGFSGCANQNETTKTTTTTGANPTDRNYDRSQLQNSGRQTTGGAIQKLEPAAQVSGQ